MIIDIEAKKQKTISRGILFLYCIFVFFLPFTKISVPVIGLYEMTLSDIAIIITGFICMVFSIRMNRKIARYLVCFFIFLVSVSISIAAIESFRLYFMELIPFIFAFFIIYTTIITFSSFDKLMVMNSIRKIILFSIFISALPVYSQMITGIKIIYFYSFKGWRYVFLCQNPNQYGIYVILFFFLLTLITLKYYREKLQFVFFLQLFYLAPIVFSGSRTATIIFTANLLLVGIIVFLSMKLSRKLIVGPIVFLLLVSMISPALNFVKTQGGQVNRALSIFAILEASEGAGLEGSDTGKSHSEAINLFITHPIFGVGMANKPMHSSVATEIHNTYYKFLAETGIVGFLGFLTIFFLPLVAMLFSRSDLLVKVSFVGFYLLWAAMNYPHMLLRQRWVWFFMVIMFLIARIDVNGKIERSKLAFLN